MLHTKPHIIGGGGVFLLYIKVARAGVLLTVKKTLVQYTVIINDLPLLTFILWITLLNLLVLAIADMCHCMQYYEQVVEGLERSKCFLPHLYRNLPFQHSSLLVPHVATKIAYLYSSLYELHILI
jgi:hypothetical protein